MKTFSNQTIALRVRHNFHVIVLAVTAIATILCLVSAPALAQGRALKVTLVQGLDFGIIGATNLNGTATIGSDGTKVVSPGVLDLGGASSPAVFLIQGEKFRTFTITLPVSMTLSPAGGSDATLTGLESTPAISGVLNQQGQATVTVGATINLTPNLSEGSYSGLLDILVAYQ